MKNESRHILFDAALARQYDQNNISTYSIFIAIRRVRCSLCELLGIKGALKIVGWLSPSAVYLPRRSIPCRSIIESCSRSVDDSSILAVISPKIVIIRWVEGRAGLAFIGR